MTVNCVHCNGCSVFTTSDLTCLFCSYMTLGRVCSSTRVPLCVHDVAVVALSLTWSSCRVAVVLGCSPPPPTYKPLLPSSVVVSVFHHSLPSSPFFFFLFFLLLLFLGCLDLAAPPPLDSVSVFMGPGTIRKAQNLLKQYSQHGLDGKKGGSNLTPLEGNAPRSRLRCLFLPPCCQCSGEMLCFMLFLMQSNKQTENS